MAFPGPRALVILCDPELRVRDWLRDDAGVGPSAPRGSPLVALFAAAAGPAAADFLCRLREGGSSQRIIPFLVDGTSVPVEWSGIAVEDGFLVHARLGDGKPDEEEEGRLARVVEAAPEAIFVQAGGRFAYANAAACQLFGAVDAAELEGRPVIERFDPEDRPAVLERIRQLNEGGQPVGERDEVILTLGGERRYVRVSAVPFSWKGTAGALVFAHDQTDRLLAEARTREVERNIGLLARLSQEAMWDWHLESDSVWCSEGFERLFGSLSNEPMTGERWADRIHPEHRAGVMERLLTFLRGHEVSWADEYRFRRSDGTWAWVSDRAHVLRDETGAPVRMFGLVGDLTSHREREHTLREQARLLDEARDAIIVRGLDHKVIYWNKGAERLYGWTSDEVRGRSVLELLYRETEAFEEAVAATVREGEWTGELVQYDRTGQSIIVEGRWTVIKDERGTLSRILSISTDITKRKKLERQFLRAQRMESIGTLAGGIAHDLNNLLSPITMGAQLLESAPLDERYRRIVGTIAQSASRGAEVVRQILSFARGIEGSNEVVDVGAVVREVAGIVASTFPKNVDARVSVAPDLWPVRGDATHLNQVLLNLCVNARDAMPDGGVLTITASNINMDELPPAAAGSLPGPYVLIEVTDTGTGMTSETIERAFDPFFTTKEPGHGTGLGLSTVLGIVKSHGGFVNVYSEPGQGSMFRVHLSAATGEPMRLEQAAGVSGEHLLARGETILLVDDEEAILDITRVALEANGYRVLLAEDGAQAIALYATHRSEIDLVLTDMMMPVMDGPALVAALRRVNPNVLMIATSGLQSSGRMASAGVRHVLQKPYSATSVLRMVREVLDGREA